MEWEDLYDAYGYSNDPDNLTQVESAISLGLMTDDPVEGENIESDGFGIADIPKLSWRRGALLASKKSAEKRRKR